MISMISQTLCRGLPPACAGLFHLWHLFTVVPRVALHHRLYAFARIRGLNWKAMFLLSVVALVSINANSINLARTPESRLVRWVQLADGKMFVEVTLLPLTTLRQMANWTPQQFQTVLAVYAGQAGAGLPPMLGKYRIDELALRFEPQFALEPGVTYRAVFLPGKLPGGSGNSVITATFTPPPRDLTPTTVVTQIYPSADLLPENLLKFYLHFSAPMSRGSIYDYIRLLDEAGKAVELPFLEIDEELWDAKMTRLTLFIDPGRIKRGVKPLEEIGPSLEAGKSYTLVISREWQDGNGNPLKEDYRKSFKVVPPDREPPDPASWQIKAPPVGTHEPLTVVFPEPMEHALVQRMIRVVAETGEAVAGNITLNDHERRWTFIPDNPWLRGQYNLVIQTTLEDLAGNNIGKPFEVDLFEGIQRQLSASTIRLTFGIR